MYKKVVLGLMTIFFVGLVAGAGYVYSYDARVADNLSAYCNIDFRSRFEPQTNRIWEQLWNWWILDFPRSLWSPFVCLMWMVKFIALRRSRQNLSRHRARWDRLRAWIRSKTKAEFLFRCRCRCLQLLSRQSR